MSRKDVDYRYPDPNLRAKLEQALGKDQSEPITAEELAGLSGQLNASESNISDLTGLEHCTNLTELVLGSNQISDISALSNLNHLTGLYLGSNQISDISTLSNLNNLTGLDLGNNEVSDISALADLTNLTELYLGSNQISDISALTGLTNLTSQLVLSSNQISDITALSNLNHLTYLGLDGNQLTASAGPIIQALKDGGTTVTHDEIPAPAEVIIPAPNLRAKPWPFDDELAINDTSPTNPFRLGIYYPKWLRGKEKILNPYHDQFSKKILDLKRNSESRIDYFMQELNPRMGSNFAIVVVPSSDPEKQQGIRTLGIKLANAAPGRVDANGCLVRTRSLPEEYKRDINYQLQSINVTDTDLITGRKVLLLDDVSTSGISLEACKKLLLDAGAVEVQCAVLGKTADSWSLKGVIFDLDQTLVDSDIVKPFRDSRKWDLVEREIPKVRPYDRIKPLVNKLRNRNIKIGIVTSSPSVYCRQVLKQCSLRVDDIVGYHDTQRRKPHPDPLQLSLRKLGLDPRDVVAIGDKADDVCAAKAAGIISIAACWGVNESDRRSLTGSGANIICRTVEELEKKLQQWWYSWP